MPYISFVKYSPYFYDFFETIVINEAEERVSLKL